MRIRTVIIEDEVNARKALENILNFYFKVVEVVGVAGSVAEGADLIKELQPDLLFLDVQLTDGTSFDLIKKIKQQNFKLIFITAHDEYALKAIKLSALDYLLKPVNPGELGKAISKVQEAIEKEEQIDLQLDTIVENAKEANQDKKIILNTASNLFVVEVKNLVRCEASENYTQVFVDGKEKIMMAKTLKEFEEMLSGYGFFRTHQSHLINIQFVEGFDKSNNLAMLKTGEQILVSTRKKESFLKALQTIL